MLTLIQKVHVEDNHSFACRLYRTPHFETNWHKHEECELIIITEGDGTALIGDYIGHYNPGDIFFMSGNLPHWFRKSHHKMIGSAVVAQFRKDFWGDDFLHLPEMKPIKQLLSQNDFGIKLKPTAAQKIAPMLKALQNSKGIDRIYQLMQCLQEAGKSTNYKIITDGFSYTSDSEENSAIKAVFDYTLRNYLKKVTLQDVADIAGMSIPTFCRFFKKNIKKTYFDFLKELRIGYACKLLTTGNKPVLEICYESGYNSWAHFSKQFKQVKKTTPLHYRKQFVA
jgi:AraC-like DNA-binding protein